MKQRIRSTIVMLVVFIPFLIIGNIPFNIFTGIVALFAFHELINLRNVPFIMKLVSYILMLLLLYVNYGTSSYNLILLVSLIILFVPLVIYHNDKVYNILDVLYLFSFIIIVSILFNNFIIIRRLGINYMIYLILISTLCDSFALIMGKKYGKRKLIPSISPNKTVEGALYGTIISTLVSSLFYIIFINDMNIFMVLIITLILSIMGQVGDLVFSSIKRYFNIKDYSNLIPGHGGIFDRFDSILFVMITYLIIINI